ncbi:MAG TPA: hypothetical protein VMA54_12180 [Steroidobacteraceae bacterium]|nr:hypothetical protein [Steroidobacteraceae bacterium]
MVGTRKAFVVGAGPAGSGAAISSRNAGFGADIVEKNVFAGVSGGKVATISHSWLRPDGTVRGGAEQTGGPDLMAIVQAADKRPGGHLAAM